MGLRGTQHGVHHGELLLPQAHLLLDVLPLGLLDLLEPVALDDNGLVHLVETRVNNLVGNSFNGPLLHILAGDIEQLGQSLVAEVGLVTGQTADLHVALLLDGLLAGNVLRLHQLLELRKFAAEVLGTGAREQVQELEGFFLHGLGGTALTSWIDFMAFMSCSSSKLTTLGALTARTTQEWTSFSMAANSSLVAFSKRPQ